MSDKCTVGRENLIELTSDIVSAHVSYNSVAAGDVPKLIETVFSALSNLPIEAPTAEPDAEVLPAWWTGDQRLRSTGGSQSAKYGRTSTSRPRW
ncbi:MAG: MucR family transcriptional regulator [Sphingomonadales bacterium]|nr:MucR family transcriptional regulator [Sphingomonadales bacterium]